jgi:hypothetical protein
MLVDWEKKTHKTIVRERIIGDKKRSHVLFLPGHTALDVECAIKRKVIGPDTQQTYCEKDLLTFKLLNNRLREIIPDGYLRPKVYRRYLHELQLKDDIDLAWLDLCGNMTPEDCFFVKDTLLPKMANGGDIAITLATYFRNNGLLRGIIDACSRDMPQKMINKVKSLPQPKTVASQWSQLMCLFAGYSYKMEVISYESADSDNRSNGRQWFNVFVARNINRGGGNPPLNKKLLSRIKNAMGVFS